MQSSCDNETNLQYSYIELLYRRHFKVHWRVLFQALQEDQMLFFTILRKSRT
nr:unnamed protein product [Callosobruchus chinensis]